MNGSWIWIATALSIIYVQYKVIRIKDEALQNLGNTSTPNSLVKGMELRHLAELHAQAQKLRTESHEIESRIRKDERARGYGDAQVDFMILCRDHPKALQKLLKDKPWKKFATAGMVDTLNKLLKEVK